MGLPYEDIANEGNNTTTYSSGNPRFILDSLSASPYNSANEFSFHLTQGSLKFVNLHAKLSGSYPLDEFLVPNTWKTKFDLENSTTVVLKRPISITRLDDDRQFTPEKLENLEYEIEFEHTTVTPATSSAYLTSYADVTFGNLRTYSGDVHKVKLFGRQKDQQNAEFRKFGEFTLQPKNEIKDSTSVTGEDPIGVFYSQSIVDNFWQTSSAQPIQIDNSRIMNAVLVSGSNYNDGDYVEFKTKNQFELEKDEEYIVSFKSYFIKKDKKQADDSVIKNAEIEVFLSGSVVSQTGGVLSLGSISSVGDNASELLTGNVSGSIPNLYNYFTTHKKSGAKPKAGLVFRVNAGEFYISNVRLEPVSDRNFNPGFYKTFVPMPIAARRGQRYDFVAEFYDSNNNKADFEAATSASVLFAGAKQVLADGTDAVLSGSVQIGDSMEMYGVNPAYLRSIGYQGFDKTIAGTGDRNGGFMLWSGSVGSTIGASETYNGVGLEVVDASSTNKHEHAFLQFASNYKGAGNSRFRVQTSEFLLGVSGSGATETFISGSQGKLRISSSNFHLDTDGSVTMQGTITATAGGTIGGFTIGSDNLTATNFVLNTTDKSLSMGSGNNIFIADADTGIQLGHATFGSAPFRVTPAGVLTATSATIQGAITATSGEIGGFNIDSTTLFSDSKEFVITGSTGQITGSKVLFTGGKITGSDFNIDVSKLELKASGLQISSTVPSMSLGTGQEIMMRANTNSPYIALQPGVDLSSKNYNEEGIFFGVASGNTPKFSLVKNTKHLRFDGTNLEVNAGNFSVDSSGNITATGGTVGGFTIDADEIKAGSTLILDSNTNSGQIKLGGATSITAGSDGVYMDGTGDFRVGETKGHRIEFDQSAGTLIMSSSKFMLGSKGSSNSYISSSGNLLEISSSNFRLSSSGDVSVEGTITATAGTIGGFSIGSSTLTGTNFTIDTSDKSITLGSSNNVFIADADDGIQLGHASFASAPFSVTPAGALKATSGTIGGFTLSANELTATNFELNPSGKRITLGSGTDIFIADGDEGIQLGNSTFANAPFSVTKAGVLKAEQGFIGGFAITSGSIETTDFASGLKGLRLSTAANGTIEAENARIRGTLATTVFEKETVNAVGGQLLVANSTAITSSAFHSLPVSASQTAISVVNVTGFAANEILLIKKVGDTGFSTEYVKVTSSSRDVPSSDKNFSGRLFVNRAINSGSMSSAGMFMESGSSAQEYEAGQVIVSTGKTGTGFIKLNANPNDVFTPYIDIVERTGSAVYDIDLKARLGDLTGLSSALVGSNPGFGLFSENVFLTGKITATSGEIGGITIASDKIYSGTGTHGNSNTPFFVQGGSAATAGDFSLGDKLVWDASESTLNIDGTLTLGSISGLGAFTGSMNTRTGSLDTLETRVVIHNGGMYLRNQGGDTLTSIGSSIALGTSGSNEENILIDNNSVDVRSGTTVLSSFGATTTLGNTSNEHIQISGSGIELKDGSTQKFAIQNSGVSIGTPGQARTEITDTEISMFSGQSTPRKRVEISSDGLIALGGATDADVSVTSTDDCIRLEPNSGITIFSDSNNKSVVDANGLTVTQGGNQVARFAATTTIGSSTDKVTISDSGITIRENNADTISLASGVVTIGSSTDKVTINGTSGITIRENNSDTISMINGVVTIGSSTDQVEINGTSGITIRENNVDTIALSGGSVVVGEVGASKSNVQITSGAINLRNNTTNKMILASDGSITIGDDISIASGGGASIAIGSGNSIFKADSNGIYLGNATFASAPFRVTPAGALTSTSATITGAITATSGVIGGWNIDGNTLKSDDNSIVLDEGNDIIKVVGTAAGIGGSSLATSAELFNDGATSGSSFRILKDGMDGSTDVEIVKINSSQQYKTGDIDTDYTTNVDKKSIAFTNSGTGDSDITTTFAAGDTSWPDNGIIGYLGAKGTGATNGLVCQMAENTGSFNLLDTQEDNNVVEITFQNLRESIVDSGTTGTKKSRYQWKAEIYQSDTNSASPSTAELVGSFKISSLLTDTTSNSAVTTPDLYVLNKRYFFVSFKGWGYDELTDDTDGKKFELDFNGAPISATQYLPKTRMTALGLQSYAGPNQNAMFGAKNEIIGDFITRKTSADTRGNIQVEGKASIGTIEIDDTFTLYTEGEIGASGNITAFYSSDKRLKENIVEIKDGLSIVNQLRPVKFDWKEDSPFAHLKPTEYGLIAQEVEEVIPEVVGRMKQDYRGVKYEGLVPLLIQSIKDLTKRVEDLEERFIRK